jgi:chemotaxis protein MotB
LARKKKHEAHANHERWLVSYADFITLLFAFFVVMFASSQTDKAKAQRISESVTDALDHGGMQAIVHEVLGGTVDEKGSGNAMMKGPGGSEPKNVPLPPPPPISQELLPKLKYLNEALQAEIRDGKLEIKQEDRGLVISLRQAAFFPSGDDTIDPKSYEPIDKIASIFRDVPNPIRLEGHTDSIPIHTAHFRNNWELSAARGVAMLELMNTKFGIPHERLAVVGYADTVPKASNDTEEGRARNRRVDIVILNQPVASPQPEAKPAAPPQVPPAPPKKK